MPPICSLHRCPAFWAVGWVLALVAGSLGLMLYGSTPGAMAAPGSATITTDGRAHLQLFLHPRCPCSRATVAELERLLTEVRDDPPRVTAHLFAAQGDEAWTRGGLRNSLERLPGVDVVVDPDGETAARSGAFTSGHVLLHDAQGQLRFYGGLTGGRGHEGNNPGRRAVVAWLRGESNPSATYPTYGCPLQND